MIDASEADIAIVKEILRKHLQTEKVWIFGSRVTGKARNYSDLDIAIETLNGKALNLKLLLSMQSDFAESDLPWEVDVVDYNTIDSEFREIIDGDKHALDYRDFT